MKFVEFIENRFQEVTLKTQSESYDIRLDAELKALHQVLTGFRTTLKWLSVPMVLYKYSEVYFGLAPAPEPVMINKLKKEKEERDALADKSSKLRSIKPDDSLPPGEQKEVEPV
jgi:hypothetical protein